MYFVIIHMSLCQRQKQDLFSTNEHSGSFAIKPFHLNLLLDIVFWGAWGPEVGKDDCLLDLDGFCYYDIYELMPKNKSKTCSLPVITTAPLQ